MAGYWPSSFLSFFIDQEKVEVNKSAEKNEANIQPYCPNMLGQYRIYYFAKKRTFYRGTNAGNPEQARWVHLACSGSQSEHRIHFILPAH